MVDVGYFGLKLSFLASFSLTEGYLKLLVSVKHPRVEKDDNYVI